MNTIKTQIHTIIMLIGPSGSGKTTFAKEVLIPKLEKPFDETKNFKPNIQYIGSDDIRQEMLGLEADKFDTVMTESSELAFKMLFTKLDLVTQYPINAEFVILDTTGLSDEFRNQVLDVATKNNYNVDAIIFDYKKMDEYKRNFDSENLKGKETNGRIVANHVKRLRTEVMKTMKKNMYRNITKIKSKDFIEEIFEYDGDVVTGHTLPTYNVSIWDGERYEQRILPTTYDWITIGDVHGCITELKELLIKYGFEIVGIDLKDTEQTKNKGLIFVGDLIDKASDEELEETIRFIHNNMNKFGDRFHMVMGNHEEMVWKWITDHPSLEKTAARYEQKEKYYNTTFLLEKNEELRNMFMDIFKVMRGWVKVIGTHNKSFIVTHAPCEVKYLEKMDKVSLTKQYKCASRSKNKGKTNDELTPYLMSEAIKNQPMHIFGHMGQTSIRTYKNKVCIDTGCVYGHTLTGYTVGFNRPFIQSVESKKVREAQNDFSNDLFSTETHQEAKAVNIGELCEADQKRLHYIMKNKIGYIGGTISPTDKDEETGKLESLKTGLDYYKGKVNGVVLQPKYMGSRAQLYLNRDIEKCYATSRNGYKIRSVELTDVFQEELDKHKDLMDKLDVVELVLDGELMPWAAMGEGLIDRQFKVIDKAIKSEIDFLKENKFDESFSKLVTEWEESGYDTEKASLNKKELQEKFGHAHNNYRYVKFESERWQPIEKHQEAWETYHEQIELYGSTGDVHYKPFRILKGVRSDGTLAEISLNTWEQFGSINSDSFHVVNFSDKHYQAFADEWYDKITKEQKLEGCVIKPIKTDFPHYVAPFLKARNPDYLTIIYGYDMYFPVKFKKLFNQKNTNRKIKASIKEYKIGEKMLELDISSDEFKQTVANFMFENQKDRNIDPRL